VARRLLHHLDSQYDLLCAADLRTLEASWRERLGLLGKEVVAECADGAHRGRLRDVTWEEIALVRADGSTHLLRPEVVAHLHPA
jgi:hypothetical protein